MSRVRGPWEKTPEEGRRFEAEVERLKMEALRNGNNTDGKHIDLPPPDHPLCAECKAAGHTTCHGLRKTNLGMMMLKSGPWWYRWLFGSRGYVVTGMGFKGKWDHVNGKLAWFTAAEHAKEFGQTLAHNILEAMQDDAILERQRKRLEPDADQATPE